MFIVFFTNLMNRAKSLYSPILKLREFVSASDLLNSLGNADGMIQEML